MADVQLDGNYPTADNLKYIDPDGAPIEGATLRVYKKIDYDLDDLSAAVGVTTTDSNGHWTDAMIVESGFTYVVQFHKPGSFGPDTEEVIIP